MCKNYNMLLWWYYTLVNKPQYNYINDNTDN